MRDICFTAPAFDEYNDWGIDDKKIQKKIKRLIDECIKNPFEGTGKPEALKYDFKGYWSRRITGEHRLIYKVTDDMVTITHCKNHYAD